MEAGRSSLATSVARLIKVDRGRKTPSVSWIFLCTFTTASRETGRETSTPKISGGGASTAFSVFSVSARRLCAVAARSQPARLDYNPLLRQPHSLAFYRQQLSPIHASHGVVLIVTVTMTACQLRSLHARALENTPQLKMVNVYVGRMPTMTCSRKVSRLSSSVVCLLYQYLPELNGLYNMDQN